MPGIAGPSALDRKKAQVFAPAEVQSTTSAQHEHRHYIRALTDAYFPTVRDVYEGTKEWYWSPALLKKSLTTLESLAAPYVPENPTDYVDALDERLDTSLVRPVEERYEGARKIVRERVVEPPRRLTEKMNQILHDQALDRIEQIKKNTIATVNSWMGSTEDEGTGESASTSEEGGQTGGIFGVLAPHALRKRAFQGLNKISPWSAERLSDMTHVSLIAYASTYIDGAKKLPASVCENAVAATKASVTFSVAASQKAFHVVNERYVRDRNIQQLKSDITDVCGNATSFIQDRYLREKDVRRFYDDIFATLSTVTHTLRSLLSGQVHVPELLDSLGKRLHIPVDLSSPNVLVISEAELEFEETPSQSMDYFKPEADKYDEAEDSTT